MQGGGLSKCSLLLLVAIEAIYAISLGWHDNCIYLACSLNFTARIWVSYMILPQLLQSWMNHSLLLKERIFPCIWGKATARLEARSPESEGGSNGICDVQAKPGGRWLSVFWVWVLRHKDDEKLHQVKKLSSFQFPYETSCVTILCGQSYRQVVLFDFYKTHSLEYFYIAHFLPGAPSLTRLQRSSYNKAML